MSSGPKRRHKWAAELIWRCYLKRPFSDRLYYGLMDRFAGFNGYRPLWMRHPEHFSAPVELQKAMRARGGVPPSTEST